MKGVREKECKMQNEKYKIGLTEKINQGMTRKAKNEKSLN